MTDSFAARLQDGPDARRPRATQLAAFFERLSASSQSCPRAEAPYADWHAWSCDHPAEFWSAVWHVGGIVAEDRIGREPWDAVVEGFGRMAPPSPAGGPRWFRGARLNYAENLLRPGAGDAPVLIFRDERGRRSEWSRSELSAVVSRMATAFRALGIRPGDCVAGFLPNIPEAVVAMLAAAACGAVWTSCSPDFGTRAVIDRFGQIAPRILVAADGHRYAGREFDGLTTVAAIADAIPAIECVVVVPQLAEQPSAERLARIRGAESWRQFMSRGEGAGPEPTYVRLPFDHPLFVLYSSGTSGAPKCIVHGAGGTLLQHVKEHLLHTDLRAGERIFFFTTCGWMMWNWLVSALAAGATIVLYDGAPMPPGSPGALWTMAAQERVNVFGTSAKYLALSEKNGLRPIVTDGLPAMRTILSTGSPLSPHSFDYVSRDVRSGVHMASISGGTDIISCFALGNPMLPVRRGELQCRGLGMAVDVFDETGAPVRGVPGELVCTRPFPSMPLRFWNDPGGEKYRAAYFAFFPGVWRHGDWAEITAHDGMIIHGRSDATLNPGGIRIGTAELYRLVDELDEVIESVAVAQETTRDGAADTRMVLFVRLSGALVLDEALQAKIRAKIRAEASPHHVPKVIIQVTDIPRTVSGKLSELAVREVIHGRPVVNLGALANPSALDLYRNRPELSR